MKKKVNFLVRAWLKLSMFGYKWQRLIENLISALPVAMVRVKVLVSVWVDGFDLSVRAI